MLLTFVDMENYVVSARKYRPRDFEAVVGQQHVTRTLEKAIETNHLAQALLFTGPRGVGKTTCARILAQRINSAGRSEEENAADDFSFNIFELDAASNNSVEDIRQLIDQVRIPPQTGRYRVYIIDEVHMLSQSAFNAFLKTLEEPPAHAIFILATTEKHKIIPTILSRCQIYDFRRISVEDIMAHLRRVAEQENLAVDDQALRIIAQKADGALRDALSIFDRMASFADGQITYAAVMDNLRLLDYDYYFRAIDAVLAQDTAALLQIFEEVLTNGFDGHLFLGGLASHLRELLVCQDTRTLALLEVGEELRGRYKEQAQQVSVPLLLRGLKSLSEADYRYKASYNQRLLVELALLELLGHQQKLTESPSEGEKKKPESLAGSSRPDQAPQREGSHQDQVSAPAEASPQSDPRVKAGKAGAQVEAPSSEEQGSSSSGPQAESPAVAEKSPASVAPAREKLGLGRKKRSAQFSIKQSLQGDDNAKEQEEEAPLDPNAVADDGLPRQAFSPEALAEAWNLYLAQDSVQAQRRVVASLSGKPLRILADDRVELTLDNGIQADTFEEIKSDLIPFLRQHLSHYGLRFELKITETQQVLEPYTPQEKYQYLLKQNPDLARLKERLQLDIE